MIERHSVWTNVNWKFINQGNYMIALQISESFIYEDGMKALF